MVLKRKTVHPHSTDTKYDTGVVSITNAMGKLVLIEATCNLQSDRQMLAGNIGIALQVSLTILTKAPVSHTCSEHSF